MDNKDIKRRDVLDFDQFSKAYNTVTKAIPLSKDKNAHPGAHEIKSESLYVRNDANPYKAMGIAYDEKQADINPKYMNANQVDVFHGRKLTNEEKQKVTDAYGNQVVTHHQMAFILDESISDEIKFGKLNESTSGEKRMFSIDDLERIASLDEAEESEEESAEPKEEQTPEEKYKEMYVDKSVTLNGDHAKISDESGVAKIQSATNELTMPWVEVNDVMVKKSGNFRTEKEKEEKKD